MKKFLVSSAALLVLSLCSAAGVPIAAQAEPDQDRAASPDGFALYRTLGRTWVLREARTFEKSVPTFQRYEVTEVTDTHAVVAWGECKDQQGRRSANSTASTFRVHFRPGAKIAEGMQARVATRAGEFECVVTTARVGADEYSFWHSVQFPGLIVKAQTAAITRELVGWWPDGQPKVADDSTSDGDASADPYALYKKEGRAWMHKTVSRFGDIESVSYIKYEITKVTADHAMQKLSMLDKDKKEMEYVPASETKIEFRLADSNATGDVPKVDTKEETIKVEAGEFECLAYVFDSNGVKTTSWLSKKFPGLLVKSTTSGETAGMKLDTVIELVEWKE